MGQHQFTTYILNKITFMLQTRSYMKSMLLLLTSGGYFGILQGLAYTAVTQSSSAYQSTWAEPLKTLPYINVIFYECLF